MNRRQFSWLAMSTAGAMGLAATVEACGADASSQNGDTSRASEARKNSVNRAYRYISTAMDAYQQAQTLRLIQSFTDSQGLGSTGFVYDNSLAILAYLNRAKGDDVARARLLGDSFLCAQTHDETYADGRVRQAYWVGPFTLSYASNDVRNKGPSGSPAMPAAAMYSWRYCSRLW